MPRRPNDVQINFDATPDELREVKNKAGAHDPPLSVANFLRSLLGLPLREAGGYRESKKGKRAAKTGRKARAKTGK